jgi:hypothetical protein
MKRCVNLQANEKKHHLDLIPLFYLESVKEPKMIAMKKTLVLLAIAATASTTASAFVPASSSLKAFSASAVASKTLPVAR